MPLSESLAREITTPVQVLVEGRTPEIFFREMTERLGFKKQIQVRDFGDIDSLTPYLKTFTQLPEFIEKVRGLGIIRDAEQPTTKVRGASIIRAAEGQTATAAFHSVCESLRVVNIAPPAQIGVVQTNDIKVGAYILPDCDRDGMLETLCWDVIRTDPLQSQAIACIEQYFDCLRNSFPPPPNKHKAQVWAFLATQMTADPQVGRAAQKKIWDWNSAALVQLRAFFSSLAAD